MGVPWDWKVPEHAGAHSFFKCNFLFRNFSGNIKENECAYLIKGV